MKSTIFFISIYFILIMTFVNCEDEITKLRRKMIMHASECYNQMNITKEEGQKMRADHDFAKKRLRCYSACFMKKTNEMNENNQLNMNTISSIEHTLYPEKADEMMKVLTSCSEKVKGIADMCDLANAYEECSHQKI
ncbi:general odorant-binding protein 19d-like [Leptopilina heterotoma]|uniref:general odorant-binding protein 19d-like n=1 Tax=Leptopilina heterotoma TaxID=63436 RepID=UPI001CAA0FCE|nr:general odorant-binding protein 19d-like [Leptopilina heterotoma]